MKTLSGGNQQRVVLAKWMATEPARADSRQPDRRRRHQRQGRHLRASSSGLADAGVAVLMISDEIPEVLYHSHRVLVMRQGRITGDVPAGQTSEAELSDGGQCVTSAPGPLPAQPRVLAARRHPRALRGPLGLADAQFLTLQNLFDLLTSYAFVGHPRARAAGGADRRRHRHLVHGHRDRSPNMWRWRSPLRHGGNWLSRVRASPIGIGIALGADQRGLHPRSCKIPCIIVTIATLNIFYGLLIFVTGGNYIYSLPDWFATGIFWFEYRLRQGQILRAQPADPGARSRLPASPGCCSTAPISAGRSMRWAAIPTRRSGSAFTSSGSTCWSTAIWASMAGVASLVQAQLAQSVAPDRARRQGARRARRRRARRRQPARRRRHGVRHLARARAARHAAERADPAWASPPTGRRSSSGWSSSISVSVDGVVAALRRRGRRGCRRMTSRALRRLASGPLGRFLARRHHRHADPAAPGPVVVFALVDRRAVSSPPAALQSMAFQMPELGILSLAMMLALLSGGLNLSIIATANLCAPDHRLRADPHAARQRGPAPGSAWQVAAIVAGFASPA